MQITFESLEELDQFFLKYHPGVSEIQTEERLNTLKTQNQLLLLQLQHQTDRQMNPPVVLVPKERAKRGTLLAKFQDAAEILIKKHVVFTRADIGLNRSPGTVRCFDKWVETQNVEIQKGLAKQGPGGTVKYIPYYYENGVKILATDVAVRDKDVIKGAAYKPMTFKSHTVATLDADMLEGEE